MKRIILNVILALLVSVVGGCAFTQANLNIKYDAREARVGPMASIKPMTINVQEFVDKRIDKSRIGYKRNGFGQRTADIVTQKPVPQIVREALIAELIKNGHKVSTTGNSLTISGDITNFWFDVQIHLLDLEFIGTVEVKLNIIDPASGAILYSHTYQGYYDEKRAVGLEGTWESVMNTALKRMVRNVSTDPELLKILRSKSISRS